jgi:Flp pilus assembly pilin Flp
MVESRPRTTVDSLPSEATGGIRVLPDQPNRAPEFGRRLERGAGQGLVEYGLILVIVAVVCVLSLVFFGDQLSSLLSLIASAV